MRSTRSVVRGWIGEALPRLEDKRFLTGEARYVGDMKLPDMLHAAFVRSVYAHGHLRGIDAAAAKAAPGVRAVLTGADLEGETAPFPLLGGEADLVPVLHPVLARDRVRYVGEPVALVVADTAEQAVDAAEWVMLEVEELSALVDPREAEAAPPLHDEAPDNVRPPSPPPRFRRYRRGVRRRARDRAPDGADPAAHRGSARAARRPCLP